MRIWAIGLILAVSACTSAPNTGGQIAVGALPVSTASAFFASYPNHFFDAIEAGCSTPRDTLVRDNANQLRCESLPDPEMAAALILHHNGTVEEIPTFVIAFDGEQQQAGYLVTVDNYIRVPQRSGEVQQLRFPDAVLQDGFQNLLEQAGGRPL